MRVQPDRSGQRDRSWQRGAARAPGGLVQAEPRGAGRPDRWGAVCTGVGATLIYGPMWVHPPTFHPHSPAETLATIATHAHRWTLIHWTFAAGAVLLAFGLLALHRRLTAQVPDGLSLYAAAGVVAALPIWIAVVTFEAAGWPAFATAFADLASSAGATAGALPAAAGPSTAPGDRLWLVVANAIWAANLALAYIVAGLVALAMVLWGIDLRRARGFPRGLAPASIVLGAVSLASLPAAWSFPQSAVFLFVPLGAAVFAWAVAVAVCLWQGGHPGNSSPEADYR